MVRDELETEPDMLAFESIEDMAESSCSSTHTNRAKSAMRSSPVIRNGTMLADEVARRCRGSDGKSEPGTGKSKLVVCACTLYEKFASCPVHFQGAMPKKVHPTASSESKMRHASQKKEMAVKGELVEHVRVSKDPVHEADYSGIHEALAAVAGRGHLVEVIVYPGQYEEPPLLIESNVRLVGLSSTSHLSASQPGCTDKSKPVIVCTDAANPALVSRGTGSLIRNFRFLEPNKSNTHATNRPLSEEQPSSNSRGKRPLISVTERMETSLSFDWTTPPDCQRLPKAKRRGRGNFEDVVSELAAVKSEMESLRSKIREDARGWRSDASIWGTVGFSITQDAFPPRVDPASPPLLSGPCMIDVVAGKVEVEDCVWDGRPGVCVSHADAVVRRCSGPGSSSPGLSQCPSLRVKGCGNLSFC